MLDRMVIAIQTEDILIMTKVYVVCVTPKDDLGQRVHDIITGRWVWSPETMDKYGDKVECFLLDPKLWKDVAGNIRWPMAHEFPEELGGDWHTADDAIKRCRLAIYRACKMHWSHSNAMAYVRAGQARVDIKIGKEQLIICQPIRIPSD